MPYEIQKYQRDATTNLAPPELLKVHRLGKSPVITDGPNTIIESGAILEYIVRMYGKGRLAPAETSPDWPRYLQLMHYAEGSAMLPVMLKLYTSRLGEAGAPLAPRITSEIENHFGFLDAELANARLLRRQGAQRRRHQPVVPDPGRAAPARARQVPEPGALPRPHARPPGLQAARSSAAGRTRSGAERASLLAMARGALVQVMDTTLRDGEQTPNVAYSPSEKLQIARLLLEEVKVDRLEVGQAFVSEGEAEAMKRITAWARRAGHAERIEIFGLTDLRRSVDWIVEHGGGAMNLLTKGSRKHCEGQLRKTPELHFKDIAETIRYARRRKLVVNVYLEDWSQGVRDSFDYVFGHMENMAGLGVRRVYLPDTLGTFTPDDTVALRRADDPHLARRALRVPRARRLRARDRQLPGRREGGRARGAHERERHGRARGQHAAGRGRGVAARPDPATARPSTRAG